MENVCKNNRNIECLENTWSLWKIFAKIMETLNIWNECFSHRFQDFKWRINVDKTDEKLKVNSSWFSKLVPFTLATDWLRSRLLRIDLKKLIYKFFDMIIIVVIFGFHVPFYFKDLFRGILIAFGPSMINLNFHIDQSLLSNHKCNI